MTRRWKLIPWDQTGTVELYDLVADPAELQNVHEQLGYQRPSNTMLQRLDRLCMC